LIYLYINITDFSLTSTKVITANYGALT